MIISHKYRFIFIKTRKTAGTSIEVYLSSLCGSEDILTPIYPSEAGHTARNYKKRWNIASEWQDATWGQRLRLLSDWLKARPFRNHSTAQSVRARIDPAIWNEYTTFCVERNPWDKTMSHYYMCKSRSNPPADLDEYLARDQFCLNYPSYCDENGDVIVDHVLKYENLESELAELFGRLGVPFEQGLKVSAKGKIRKDKRHYSDVLNDSQRDKIATAFSKEIELLGYQY